MGTVGIGQWALFILVLEISYPDIECERVLSTSVTSHVTIGIRLFFVMGLRIWSHTETVDKVLCGCVSSVTLGCRMERLGSQSIVKHISKVAVKI